MIGLGHLMSECPGKDTALRITRAKPKICAIYRRNISKINCGSVTAANDEGHLIAGMMMK